MEGKEIVSSLCRGKLLSELPSDAPKLPETGGYPEARGYKVEIFALDRRNILRRLFKRGKPQVYYVTWLRPNKLIPFIWGYLSFWEGSKWSAGIPVNNFTMGSAQFYPIFNGKRGETYAEQESRKSARND